VTFIIGTVSRPIPEKFGRFSARSAMPAGTASELRQAMSKEIVSRLLSGLERRKLICRRDPCR